MVDPSLRTQASDVDVPDGTVYDFQAGLSKSISTQFNDLQGVDAYV